ncbi:slightly ste11-like protein, partial [Coemansia sp. RSA 1933]
RSATGFPYEFDPSDSSCRNMYSTTDIDPTSAAAQQMPQQLTTNGYIRHSGGIPVGGTPHHQQQQQQPLDMTTASLPLPVDIGVDQNSQQQQQQQPSSHMHMQSGIHTSNPQSSFGSSPVGNQPIFSTLSFQSSQMPEYDSYGRQPKPRSNRVIKPKRTPRPPNAFILYRKAKQAEVIRDNPGVSNKDVSCIIGQMWKAEDPLVQDKFREQAELEKKKHKEMHPNYKYQPRKPKNKRLQEAQGMGSVSGSNGSLVHGSTAAAVAAAVAASSPGQDGSFVNGSLQSALKDPSTPISGGGFPSSYSKYHMMMQPGQISQQSPHTPQQHQQPPQSQTPVPQHQQQQIQRGGEYYYRSDQQQQAQHVHANGFVGVPPQIDIKPGFVNGISTAAYWTPATPSDAAFSNTLPSGNVFHSNDQTAAAAAAAAAAANIRPFDSVVPQHDTNPAVSAGHVMGGGGASSAPMFHAFDHQQRQSQHHHQHDIHGHADYQNSQQQYHQQHHGGHNQQQQQQGGSMLGSYVNSNQASYHHSQQGMDGLDGSSVAAADSQGLGLLSPPAVTWSTNM